MFSLLYLHLFFKSLITFSFTLNLYKQLLLLRIVLLLFITDNNSTTFKQMLHVTHVVFDYRRTKNRLNYESVLVIYF